MPRGPGKKSNYNLDYSRFNAVDSEQSLPVEEEAATPSGVPPLQDLLRSMPVELQEAHHLMRISRENGDQVAQQKANELVLKAVQQGGPEVQRTFVQELAKQSPESAAALRDAVAASGPAPPAATPAELGDTIDALRTKMEAGAEATRKQLEGLQKQQEQLERLKRPEEFLSFMSQEGGITQEDLQRIFSGDQEHMEKCMTGLLNKATAAGDKGAQGQEQVLQAAEQLHASICGVPAAETPAQATKPPEEEVKIPDHRLQYQKDAEGRYTGVELKCSMPGVLDMSAIMLDVSEKHVRLTTSAPAPRYAVNAGPFPVLIDATGARAKYSKKRCELSISVPAKKD